MELVRHEDTEQNREKLFKFYEEVYPNSPWLLDHSRFAWQSQQNPLLEPGKTEIWLLFDDAGEIIGQNIYILYELSIGGKITRGYCSTNLIVSPKLVGRGIGHRFVELNESRGGVAYAVGITPASTRAFLKFGWVHHTEARLYTMMIHPLPNLNYLKFPEWKKIAAYFPLLMAGAFSRWWANLRKPVPGEGVSFREITSFEPEHDRLWQDYLSGYAIHFCRTSSMLNYKYSGRSDVQHAKLLFEKNGQPVGYAVFRISENPVRKLRLGRIVDLVYDPKLGPDLLNYMTHISVERLLKTDVDAIVAVAANDEIGKIFTSRGFFLSRVQPAIIKPSHFNLDELRSTYQSLWYITLGDSDLDNYW